MPQYETSHKSLHSVGCPKSHMMYHFFLSISPFNYLDHQMKSVELNKIEHTLIGNGTLIIDNRLNEAGVKS